MNKVIICWITLGNFFIQTQKVDPDFGLLSGIAQQISRVKGCHYRNNPPAAVLIVQPLAAHSGNRLFVFEQGIGRTATEQHQRFGLNQINLPFQKRQTHCHFRRCRRAVPGRTPRQDVADKAVVFPVITGRFED